MKDLSLIIIIACGVALAPYILWVLGAIAAVAAIYFCAMVVGALLTRVADWITETHPLEVTLWLLGAMFVLGWITWLVNI